MYSFYFLNIEFFLTKLVYINRAINKAERVDFKIEHAPKNVKKLTPNTDGLEHFTCSAQHNSVPSQFERSVKIMNCSFFKTWYP